MTHKAQKPYLVGLIGLSLVLAACGQRAAEKPVESDLPLVPVAKRPAQPDCGPTAQTSAARLVGPAKLSGENYIPGAQLRAQTDLPANLQSLLFTTRALVNSFYYGFSKVDLQAVHARYTAEFRAGKDKSLALYPIDNSVDEGMTKYLAAFGDEHTFYLDLTSAQAFRAAQTGASTPVPIFGLGFAPLPNADGAVLLSVRGDSPAYAAGLRRGDVVVEIGGQALKRVNTSGTEAGDAENATVYSAILSAAAKKGAAVTFKYLRASQPASADIQASVLSATQLPYGELIAGTKHYFLRLPSFVGGGIADKVHTLVTDAKAKGAADIIIDLRDNGGGMITEFVGAAGAFSPSTSGEILEDISANDVTFRYNAATHQVVATDVCNDPPFQLPIAKPDLWTGKTVILTTQGSASASEAFAQVLRLGGNTYVIGETTVGVGNTFTYSFDTPGDRIISVTAGRNKLLNGQYASVDVTPDQEAKDDLSALAQGRDLAMNAALAYLNK